MKKQCFLIILIAALGLCPATTRSFNVSENLPSIALASATVAGASLVMYSLYRFDKSLSIRSGKNRLKQASESLAYEQKRYQTALDIFNITAQGHSNGNNALHSFMIYWNNEFSTMYNAHDLNRIKSYKRAIKKDIKNWKAKSGYEQLLEKAKNLYPELKNFCKKLSQLIDIVAQENHYLYLYRKNFELQQNILYTHLEHYYRLYKDQEISKKDYTKKIIKAARTYCTNKYSLYSSANTLNTMVDDIVWHINKTNGYCSYTLHKELIASAQHAIKVIKKAHHALINADAYIQEKHHYDLDVMHQKLLRAEQERINAERRRAQLERERIWAEERKAKAARKKADAMNNLAVANIINAFTPKEKEVIVVHTPATPALTAPAPTVVINNNPTITVSPTMVNGDNNHATTETTVKDSEKKEQPKEQNQGNSSSDYEDVFLFNPF